MNDEPPSEVTGFEVDWGTVTAESDPPAARRLTGRSVRSAVAALGWLVTATFAAIAPFPHLVGVNQQARDFSFSFWQNGWGTFEYDTPDGAPTDPGLSDFHVARLGGLLLAGAAVLGIAVVCALVWRRHLWPVVVALVGLAIVLSGAVAQLLMVESLWSQNRTRPESGALELPLQNQLLLGPGFALSAGLAIDAVIAMVATGVLLAKRRGTESPDGSVGHGTSVTRWTSRKLAAWRAETDC